MTALTNRDGLASLVSRCLAALVLIALTTTPNNKYVGAFQVSHQRITSAALNYLPSSDASFLYNNDCNYIHTQINRCLRMTDGDGDEDEAPITDEDNDSSTTSSTNEEDVNDVSNILSSYKSSIDPRRSYTTSPRPGSTAPKSSIDVTMKFGGSSLANAERVDRVANLIKNRIRPPNKEDGSESDEIPERPRAGKFCVVVCVSSLCVFFQISHLLNLHTH